MGALEMIEMMSFSSFPFDFRSKDNSKNQTALQVLGKL